MNLNVNTQTLEKKCEKHGTALSCLTIFGEERIFCLTCNNEGKQSQEQQAIIERNKIIHEAYYEAYKRKVGRGYDFDKANYDFCNIKTEIKDSNLLKKVIDFDDHSGDPLRGLVFTGGSGLGKTLLAKLLIKEIIYKEVSYQFIEAGQLAFDLFSLDTKHAKKFLKKYQSYDLLVIDDFGRSSKTSEYFKQFIFLLLNYRLEKSTRNLKTIITSNLSKKDLASLELLEMDRMELCEFIEFRGVSKRKSKKRKTS